MNLMTTNPFTGPMATIYIGINSARYYKVPICLTALTYGSNGEIILLGFYFVDIESCARLQLQTIVDRFLGALSQHVWIQQRHQLTTFKCAPIIECNTNEVVALSLLEAIKNTCTGLNCDFTMINPFAPRLGIQISQYNKELSILHLRRIMATRKLFAASGAITMGMSPDRYRARLAKQLEYIDNRDEKIETSVGESFLLALFLSHEKPK